MRGEVGGVVVIVDSADTDGTSQSARILGLHLVHIRRRAAAWNTHIVRDGVLPLAVALVAGGNGGHHAGIQGSLAGVAQQGALGDRRIGHTQRHAEHVATMLNSPLDTIGDVFGATVTTGVQAFDTHQRGIRRHARLRGTMAVATHRARAVRAVAVVVHRVVVVVINIETMMRKLRSTIPKVLGKVDMVVVDTRVDDGHHDALARVAQIPHLVGTHLDDVLRDFARGRSRTCFFAIGDPVAFDGIANHLNVIALRKALNCHLVGLEAQGVGHPKDGRLGRHAVALHLGKRMAKVILRSRSELLQFVDHELAALGAVDEIVSTAIEFDAVIVRLHDDDDADLLVVVHIGHRFTQKRVDQCLGIASNAEESRQEKE